MRQEHFKLGRPRTGWLDFNYRFYFGLYADKRSESMNSKISV